MTTPLIIGLSGRKQSGKNTAANQIIAQLINPILKRAGLLPPLGVNDKGVLQYMDSTGGIVFPSSNIISPWVTLLSFAEPIKRFCVDVLGLSHIQCYGTDAEKDTLTHLRWDNLPKNVWRNHVIFDNPEDHFGHWPTGRMTARQVMQVFGTDIMRKWDPDIWVRPCVKAIKESKNRLILITDVRFINEVGAIRKLGGKIIRLTHDPAEKTDKHASEQALNNEIVKVWDIVVPPDLTIVEQGDYLRGPVKEWLMEHGLRKEQP